MIYQNKQKYKNKIKFSHGVLSIHQWNLYILIVASQLLLQQILEKLAWRIMCKIVWYCGVKHCKAQDAKSHAYYFYS